MPGNCISSCKLQPRCAPANIEYSDHQAYPDVGIYIASMVHYSQTTYEENTESPNLSKANVSSVSASMLMPKEFRQCVLEAGKATQVDVL